MLHSYALAPPPSLTELRNSPLAKYTWRSVALEKLEVMAQRSGVLRLSLTTADDVFLHSDNDSVDIG